MDAETRKRLERILPDRLKEFGGLEVEWAKLAVLLKMADALTEIAETLNAIKNALARNEM
jgi:hypothetical protein